MSDDSQEMKDKMRRVLADDAPRKKVPRRARLAGDNRPTAKKVKDLMRSSMSRQPLDDPKMKSLSAKEYTKEMCMRELEEALIFARDSGNPSACAKIIETKARIAGLIDKNNLQMGAGFQIIINGLETPKPRDGLPPIEITGISDKGEKE